MSRGASQHLRQIHQQQQNATQEQKQTACRNDREMRRLKCNFAGNKSSCKHNRLERLAEKCRRRRWQTVKGCWYVQMHTQSACDECACKYISTHERTAVFRPPTHMHTRAHTPTHTHTHTRCVCYRCVPILQFFSICMHVWH